ncbi:hypothetical protein Emag_007823 [Eimeria magna]
MSIVCRGPPFRQLPRSGLSSWTSSPPVRFCTPAPSTRRLPLSLSCGAPFCALQLTMWPTAPIGGCASCGTACATCARRSAPLARLSSPLPAAPTTTLAPTSALPIQTTTAPRPLPPRGRITPPPNVVHGGRNIPLPPAVEHLSLKDAQAQDPDVKNFFTSLFCVLHDLAYVRIGDALPRVVLPAIFRSRAIQAHHLNYYGGHFGVFKTAARLVCRNWWPRLQRDVRAYFRRCPFCIANIDAPRKWKCLNLPICTPIKLIAIDLSGPLPVTRRGNNHILVIIDHHTRWVELVPLPNPTAAQVAQALFNKWISRWGVPRALLSDNGPQFTAELLRQLCTTFGISKLFASPYNPRGNSIVESYMRSLEITLRLCLQHFRQEWDVVLPAAAVAYRCTPHSVTRFSPFFLVTGQELVLALSRHANRKLFLEDPHRLEPGMHVALRIPAKERAAQGKFSPAFRGPYVVERVLPTGTTAKLVDPGSGTKLLANRTRPKFLDAPQPRSPTAQRNHYLHRRLKAYKGARKEVWKIARGLLRLPVERGWTPPPDSLVAKMKEQVEDSPAVEEIWDKWPSFFVKLERQWDDIYLAEFPEVTAAPRWGAPSWTSFLTAFSRQFIAQPSARVREVRGWKEIPEYEPEIQPDPNPALGGLLAQPARHDEEDIDEVVEARPALLTPASSGVSAELEGSAEPSPLPAPRSPGSGRAAPQTAPTSPVAPLPGGAAGQGPLAPLSPTTTVAFNALGTLAAQGAARENFEYPLQELQWVDSLSSTVATAHAVLTKPSHGQSSAAGLVDQLRREQLGGPAVTEDQVERLVGFWLSSAERLATLVGPGRTSLREFLNGVYRAGQALLGMTVASTVPSRPVDAPAAPREPSTSASVAETGDPSDLPSFPEETTPPRPCLIWVQKSSACPIICDRAQPNPPQQLGMDGLLNGSAGRSPADDASVAPVGQETGSAAELSEKEQPAARAYPGELTWFSSAEARRAEQSV